MEQNENKQEQLSDKEINKKIKEMESYIGDNIEGGVSESLEKTISCLHECLINLSFTKIFTDSKMTCIDNMYIILKTMDSENKETDIHLNPRQAMQLAAVLTDVSRRALITDINYWKRQDKQTNE